ncbi:MAG: FtsQ-type POTRA domain-containing protein [Puniceicoccales bacterium]|jgi:cell division protein FtsQ|nr:FtsQ-type POTRA domain-containing protein [Puniceicoccales bacterium]
MLFFRKKLSASVKQIALRGQKKRMRKSPKFLWGKFLLKITVYALLSLGLLYGMASLWSYLEEPLKAWGKSIYKQPLKRVEFKSDGVLTAQWVKPFLANLKPGIDLMAIDIFEIKQKLETCAQVKNAIVERQFPKTLKITVEERIPLLRLRLHDGKSTHEMFIDAEGVVFRGETTGDPKHYTIPFLSGITLKKTKGGYYEKVPNLDKVYQLLHIARTKYWPIYTQIEVVSIENLRQRSAPWSKITMRCQCATSIIFKDNDFDEQLKRLDFILNTPRVHDNLPVERIDLTLGGDAAVRFRK